MNEIQSTVSTIAKMLGMEKVNWPAAMKACRIAMKNGFTQDDFVKATQAMQQGDQKYWSIYSVFSKTDYWLAQLEPAKPEALKGVW